MKNFFKNPGFTLIEMLIATGISAIVLTTAFGTIGSVYFSQKRIQGAQDFYAEARFLMERVVQIARSNTIDYDRFFEKVGPEMGSGNCENFDADQTIDEVARAIGVPPKIIISDEDVRVIREERSKQQQTQQVIDQAEQVAGAASDIKSSGILDEAEEDINV